MNCITAALSRGEQALLIVNDEAEGCAPFSSVALTHELVESVPPALLLE